MDGREDAGATRPSGRSPERQAAAWLHPFAARLDLALRNRGLPLTRVAHHLAQVGVPVSRSTLSNWRTGQSLPRYGIDDPVITELEAVLGVNPGGLATLLGKDIDSRPLPTPAAASGDPSTPGHARFVMSHLSLEVDLEARLLVIGNRHLIEAGPVAVHRWEQTTRVTEGSDVAAAQIPMVRTEIRQRPTDQSVFAQGCITSVVNLREPLLPGSQQGSWHRTHQLRGIDSARVEHGVDLHQPMVIMQVRFRGTQPDTVHAYHAVDDAPDGIESGQLEPLNGRYHAVFRNSVRGWCGLRWERGPR